MKKVVVFVIVLFLSIITQAQTEKTEVFVFKVRKAKTVTDKRDPVKIVFVQADRKPSFPGGEIAFNNYIITNLRYPEPEKSMKKQGLVMVAFDVDVLGNITNVRILRGQTDNMNREAIRLISEMPQWTPGLYNGYPAIVEVSLPVNFKLD